MNKFIIRHDKAFSVFSQYQIVDEIGNEKFFMKEASWLRRKILVFKNRESKILFLSIEQEKKGFFESPSFLIRDHSENILAKILQDWNGMLVQWKALDFSGKLLAIVGNNKWSWNKLFSNTCEIYLENDESIGTISKKMMSDDCLVEIDFDSVRKLDQVVTISLGILFFCYKLNRSGGG